MRCLILYHTLTGESERAATLAAEAIRADGGDATLCRIEMPDPADRLARPLSLADSKRWTQAAQKGATVRIAFNPAEALGNEYDLVLLFTSTWGDHPCVPIRSFLEGPDAARVLNGRPFGVFVVCRRLWEKNLAIVRQLGEKAGGRFIAGEAFMHPGSQIGSLIQTVTYLWRCDGGRKSFLGFRLPPYGLSPEAIGRVAPFTRSLLAAAARPEQQ